MIVATDLAGTTQPLLDLLAPRPDDERPGAGFADLLSAAEQDMAEQASGHLPMTAMPPAFQSDRTSFDAIGPESRTAPQSDDPAPKVVGDRASDTRAPDIPSIHPDPDLAGEELRNMPDPPGSIPPAAPRAAVEADIPVLRDTPGMPAVAHAHQGRDQTGNATPSGIAGIETLHEQSPREAGSAPKAEPANAAAPESRAPSSPAGSSAMTAALVADTRPAPPTEPLTPAPPQPDGDSMAAHVEPARAVAPQAIGLQQAAAIAVVRQVVAAVPQAPVSASGRIVELVLAPAELGTVRMLLSGADGNLSIQITAERPETFDLLRRNVDELLRELRAGGQAEVSLDFSAGNSGFRGPQGQDSAPDDLARQRAQTGPEPLDESAAAYAPVVAILGTGRLDIRL